MIGWSADRQTDRQTGGRCHTHGTRGERQPELHRRHTDASSESMTSRSSVNSRPEKGILMLRPTVADCCTAGSGHRGHRGHHGHLYHRHFGEIALQTRRRILKSEPRPLPWSPPRRKQNVFRLSVCPSGWSSTGTSAFHPDSRLRSAVTMQTRAFRRTQRPTCGS